MTKIRVCVGLVLVGVGAGIALALSFDHDVPDGSHLTEDHDTLVKAFDAQLEQWEARR